MLVNFYIENKVTSNSQPQKLDILREKVENNKIEVTNDWFLKKLEAIKTYALASDKLVTNYKILVGCIAI